MENVKEQVLRVLQEVCQTDEVVKDTQLDLYNSGVLDSMGTVMLIASLESELDIEIPITDFDREAWSTPEKIVAYVKTRL